MVITVAKKYWNLVDYIVMEITNVQPGTFVMMLPVVATDILGAENTDRGIGLTFSTMGLGILVSIPSMGKNKTFKWNN